MWQGLVLEAKSLACERGGRLIFEGLNFALKGGEVVELRGPNGAGKSSLLRLIAGLNPPAQGEVTLSGCDAPLAQACHYVGHLEAIKPALTAQQNADFWARYLGGAKADLEAFRLSHLAEDEAALLSEGQRRRLALSRLLAAPRPLWLLDEPTVGLDVTALDDLRRVIADHLQAGGLVLAATHASLGVAAARSLQLEARG